VRGFIVATLLLAGLVLAATAHAAAYPPDSTLGSGLGPGKPPDIPRPGYLKPIVDPVFGTSVVRITRLAPLNSKRPIVRHAYSKVQPWNSDQSLLMIGSFQPRLILNGDTYRQLSLFESPTDATWSNVDPRRVYGVSGARFGFSDLGAADPEAFNVLHRFAGYRRVSLGFGEGNLSNDDHYVALIGVRRNDDRDLIVFDLRAGEVAATRRFRAPLDNATMSQSGNYVITVWGPDGAGRNHGVEVFDLELEFLRQVTPFSEHGDAGYTAVGEEAWVSYSPGKKRTIGAYPLAGGRPITVIDADPGTWGGHVSCRNLARPGWCYISDDGGSARYWRGYDQVWAQQIAPDGVAQVFAHEHHGFDSAYYRQPHAVPSRDGARVLWASDWDGGRSAPVFDYVAQAR
jgi:hypothetical protein